MKILLLLLLATRARADMTVQPCDHAENIRAAIAAKSLPGVTLTKKSDACVLEWTPKPGETITFTDKQAQRAALASELGDLEDKLDAGTITNAELRRLVKIMLKLIRISKDAP